MKKKIKSPCTGVCKYDKQNTCIACKRTKEESVNWPEYSEEQKEEILDRISGNDEPEQSTMEYPHDLYI